MKTMITIYCDNKLKEQLDEISQEEHRSLSGQILMVLTNWVVEKRKNGRKKKL